MEIRKLLIDKTYIIRNISGNTINRKPVVLYKTMKNVIVLYKTLKNVRH